MVEQNSKFLFSQDFADLEAQRQDIKKHSFSDEELNDLQQNYLAQGMEAGRQEILQGVGQGVDKLAKELSVISSSIDVHYNNHIQDSFKIFAEIFTKLLPALSKQNAFIEVEKFIQEKIQKYIAQPKIAIEVHPEILPMLQDKLKDYTDVTIELSSNEMMNLSDCTVSWEEGKVERDTEYLVKEIISRLGVKE